MFQLRIYTLRSPEALQQYATLHWARHLPTFTAFGVTTHGASAAAPLFDSSR